MSYTRGVLQLLTAAIATNAGVANAVRDVQCAPGTSAVVQHFEGPFGTAELGLVEVARSVSFQAVVRVTEYTRGAPVVEIGSDGNTDDIVLAQYENTGRLVLNVFRPGWRPRAPLPAEPLSLAADIRYVDGGLVSEIALPLNRDVTVGFDVISTHDFGLAFAKLYIDGQPRAGGQLLRPRDTPREVRIGHGFLSGAQPLSGTVRDVQLQHC